MSYNIFSILLLLATAGLSDTPEPAPAEPASTMIIGMRTGATHLVDSPPLRPVSIARWFELEAAAVGSRYRFIEDLGGRTLTNQIQYQQAFKGRFKLDEHGRFSLHGGAYSGGGLTGGWNSSGLGTGRAEGHFFLKQLYFSAQPLAGLEIQYGGLEVAHGESTEITGYDYDVYITGERLRLMRPKQLWFDEITATYAYFGDPETPGVIGRFHRLNEVNYRHFLVGKRIGRVRSSADYTRESGVVTLRQAVRVETRQPRLVDRLHFETYQRLGAAPGYGFAVYGEKALHRNFSLGCGYAQIDRNGLNSDRFPRGHRPYFTAHLALSPAFSASSFLSRAIDREGSPPRIRFELAFHYNLLHDLRRAF